MRPCNCPYCGAKSTLIARWITGKCPACHKKINGDFKIKCTHCGALNIVNSDVAKNGGCIQCKYPLNWSIPRGTYIPNFIPIERRVKYALSSVALMVFSVYSLTHNSMDLPYGSKRHAVLVHFSGVGLVLPAISLVCGALVGLSVLVDQLDKRPNEKSYKEIYDWSLIVGWVSYMAALFFADGVTNV
jgi:hypothetical protein